MLDWTVTRLMGKLEACPYNESSAFVAASFQFTHTKETRAFVAASFQLAHTKEI